MRRHELACLIAVAICCLSISSCSKEAKKQENTSITNSLDEAIGVHPFAGPGSTGSTDPTGSDDSTQASEIEKQKALATAKILAAAKSQFPDPGPFKLIKDSQKAEYWVSRGDRGSFGGTLTISTFGSGPKTFNVWEAHEVPSHGLGILMWEPLVDIDPWSGESYPRLAKEIKLSKDKLQYTITLRQGLKWSDGTPLTADDVVFTFNKIIKEGYGNSSTRDTLMVKGEFPEVTKIDDLTIHFRTREPFAPFLNGIHNVPIAPRHALSEITKKPMEAFHEFWDINCNPKDLVVSGPFKLHRYVPAQRIELSRNENYSFVDRSGRTLPYLDKFVEVVVPDQNTQILKFYGGEVDFLDVRSVRGFDAALMKQREQTGNFTMYNLGPEDGSTFMVFNLCQRKNAKTGKFYVEPRKQKWFNNLKFRQAMSHAADRQRLVDNILKGVGLPVFSHISIGSPWYNKAIKPYGQDLGYSARLLEEGGFVKEEDKLLDADGNRVEFVLNTNAGNSTRDATCVMLQNDLAKLGIKVNYQPIDFNILIDKVNTSLDYDAVVMALTGNKIEPYDSANVWKSNGRLHMFDQRLPDDKGQIIVCDARDWEKEIDDCFDRGATTFDMAKRHHYYDRYQEIVYEQLPFIYLYSPLEISAARNTIKNYRPTPLGVYYTPKGTFYNIEEIYLEGGKK